MRPLNTPRIISILIVSTHAPARGATNTLEYFRDGIRFQPTHPHGVRQNRCLYYNYSPNVSTHAPARGATWLFEGTWVEDYVSTHAPARGATNTWPRPPGAIIVSAHTTQERDSTRVVRRIILSFNPRTRTVRLRYHTLLSYTYRPTHAPARVRHRLAWNVKQLCVSTHAPARVRRLLSLTKQMYTLFQPTHHTVRRAV